MNISVEFPPQAQTSVFPLHFQSSLKGFKLEHSNYTASSAESLEALSEQLKGQFMYVCTCVSGTDGELCMYAVLRTEPASTLLLAMFPA